MPPLGEHVRPVRTSGVVGDRRVHLFQAVHDPGSTPTDWIVVSIEDDSVRLATPDFEEVRVLPVAAFVGGVEPLTAGGVPVWGY